MNGDLLPLLEDLRPIDLREDDNNQDLSFLHGETGYSLFELASWIAA